MLALSPLFLAQVVGEQYFVPVYLPLLIFTCATEGRIDGPPAAAALTASTLLCLGGSWLANAGSMPASLIAANVMCAAFLLAENLLTTTTDARGASAPQEPKRGGGDGLVRREDTALALVLSLALAAFLTTTGNPVASLKS